MTKTAVQEYVSTTEGMRCYQQERAILRVTELLEQVMREQGVARSRLAIMLGNKSKAWVTQLLDGEGNKTIRTVADVLAVLGREISFTAPVARVGGTEKQLLILTGPASWGREQNEWRTERIG